MDCKLSASKEEGVTQRYRIMVTIKLIPSTRIFPAFGPKTSPDKGAEGSKLPHKNDARTPCLDQFNKVDFTPVASVRLSAGSKRKYNPIKEIQPDGLFRNHQRQKEMFSKNCFLDKVSRSQKLLSLP